MADPASNTPRTHCRAGRCDAEYKIGPCACGCDDCRAADTPSQGENNEPPCEGCPDCGFDANGPSNRYIASLRAKLAIATEAASHNGALVASLRAEVERLNAKLRIADEDYRLDTGSDAKTIDELRAALAKAEAEQARLAKRSAENHTRTKAAEAKLAKATEALDEARAGLGNAAAAFAALGHHGTALRYQASADRAASSLAAIRDGKCGGTPGKPKNLMHAAGDGCEDCSDDR